MDEHTIEIIRKYYWEYGRGDSTSLLSFLGLKKGTSINKINEKLVETFIINNPNKRKKLRSFLNLDYDDLIALEDDGTVKKKVNDSDIIIMKGSGYPDNFLD